MVKQLFCRHKNIEYKQPITKFHALNTEPVYTVCADCGKLLKIEHLSNEEFLLRFREVKEDGKA
jgi:hypothetical protein